MTHSQASGDQLQRPQGTASACSSAPVVEMIDVGKTFGGLTAVAGMRLRLNAGEVVALVGENGAGKSTCVKMLAGVYQPSSGEIRFHGDVFHADHPLAAQRRGIAVVHQHPGLFPDLPVFENVFAGHPLRGAWGRLDRAAMRERSQTILQILGLQVDARMRTGDLSTSERQLVEIAKALATEAAVVVFDEPTASLTTGETRRLFGVIESLRSRGVAMLFVGHRLEEILEVSDRITVMRDGRWVADVETASTDAHELVTLMVGRELGDLYPSREPPRGEMVLSVQGLSIPGQFSEVSFDVRAGEIVGLAGLVGAGRTEVARAVFGIERPRSGVITLDGRRITPRSPADALAHGIAYVSEDRRGQSLIEDFSILSNAVLPMVGRTARFGLVRRRLEYALVSERLERMRLRYASLNQPVSELSGGNQQKVVLAKWLATRPRVLILDEPTQGVDVQAKAEVHRIVADLAAQGLAIVLISSDMPELTGMCDRIVVMHQGAVTAELDARNADQVDFGMAVTGVLHREDLISQGEEHESTTEATHRSRAAAGASRRSRWRGLVSHRETSLLAAIVLVLIPLVVANPAIVSRGNLTDIAQTLALYGIVCLGEMFVVLTRNIDLSVGSVVGLSAYVSADLLATHHGAPAVLGIVAATGVGLACGLINGLVVAAGGVASIVVTLGTLAIYRGLDTTLSDGRQISTGMVPCGWLGWTNGAALGIPRLTLIGLAATLIVAYVLRSTTLGRNLFATGSNPDGAELIGIDTRRTVVAAFCFSGTLAGFAGAMWASYYATVDGQLAYGTELTVIASVVVGGVSLRGGIGTVTGVVLGTLGLIVILNAIAVARLNPQYLQAFFGAAILLTVAIDAVLAKRRRRPGVRGPS